MVKKELSSVDLRVLVRELRERLVGAKVDKAYQLGEKELFLRFYGRGAVDLVAAPNFLCITKYRRPAPKTPTSFAMQLRKRLKGEAVTDVSQHGFDRIVKLTLENHILMFEVFSKGNVLLTDKNMRILGLLEWQKWKDRMLGVGKEYAYPPSQTNPFEVDEKTFHDIMGASDRGVAGILATKFGLGGHFAEVVCRKAGADAKRPYSDADKAALWSAFSEFLGEVDGTVDPHLSEDNVTPFGGEGIGFPSFNDAVDEYFAGKENVRVEAEGEKASREKRQKILDILAKQEEALVRAEKDSDEERLIGDLLYERMDEISRAAARAKEGRKEGLSDEGILKSLTDFGFVRGVRGHVIVLDM